MAAVSDSESYDPDAVPFLVTFPSHQDDNAADEVITTTSSITTHIHKASSSQRPARDSALRKLALGSWVFFGIFIFGCLFCVYQDSFVKKLPPFLRGKQKRTPNPRGPWEECLWMTGPECATFIKSQVPSYMIIEFMHQEQVNSVKDFHPNRVIIWLDANDQVIEVPGRG